MSKRLTLRVPDDLLDFVDEAVASGAAESRSSMIAAAVDRERRRLVAERDANILARAEPDPELAGLAEWAATLPLADLG